MSQRHLKVYLRSKAFQRLLIGMVTILIAFLIIENGAAPKRYRLSLGGTSPYDITAPRDIENKLKTEEMAKAAAEAVPPVMTRLDNVPIDVLNTIDDFLTAVEDARKSVQKSLQDQGITRKDKDYKEKLELEQALAVKKLNADLEAFGVPLSEEQIKQLVTRFGDEELAEFKKGIRERVGAIMKVEINDENLPRMVVTLQNQVQESGLNQELKNIGELLVKSIIKPNSAVDTELTQEKKEEAYDNAMKNVQMISAGARILSFGDVVTEDKLEVLKELNLLETEGFDYLFALGIMAMVLMLTVLLILYMHFFCKKILHNRNDVILVAVILLLALGAARVVTGFSPLLIPIFIAPMLISILLDLRLAVSVNFVLAISISFMTGNDPAFLYMALLSGSFSAFLVARANQRSKLSASGVAIGAVNALIVACIGILNKNALTDIANDALLAAVNGMIATIFTIGILPILESTFNIITPLKLLELANPNQPLIKKLLMEAPGTYHHSLMVGNLAEVATEAIGGNALLARVGAYYHDVGKLKRPNFFKENQLSENPHDRMTANLSTLVITSHTHDGMEIAEKYKVPLTIKDIIRQHHGTTLVAYFYHKAKKGEKGETVKQEDFRYQGPKPASKEAAVVMLADSVEAAVRSMVEKTEGKIEGLVRKIIKDKLDDGQLDHCELTLKDLDDIARAFTRVFSGFFHEREEYPEVKVRKIQTEEIAAAAPQNTGEIERQPENEKDHEKEKLTDETY